LEPVENSIHSAITLHEKVSSNTDSNFFMKYAPNILLTGFKCVCREKYAIHQAAQNAIIRLEASWEDQLRRTSRPLGNIVYYHDEAINTFFSPRLRFTGDELTVYHHGYQSSVCPASLIYGCRAPGPVHTFRFDNEPLASQGDKGEVVRLNVWNQDAGWPNPPIQGKGFIATYRCTLTEDAPNGVIVELN